jgi:PBP1b-binding outer membrane lipoprotein LpoB
MKRLVALATVLGSVVLINGCSKCSRDPEPPVPATEPAATGPEEMHNNPGIDQPGANDPGDTDPNAIPDENDPPPGADEDVD